MNEKAAENLIPGGAIDWEDVEKCSCCEIQHEISQLVESDGELFCEPCMLKAPEESILRLWLS